MGKRMVRHGGTTIIGEADGLVSTDRERSGESERGKWKLERWMILSVMYDKGGESLTMIGGMRRKNGYMRGKNGNQEGRMERKSNGESYPLYIAKQETTWERRGQHGMKGGSLTKREYETITVR